MGIQITRGFQGGTWLSPTLRWCHRIRSLKESLQTHLHLCRHRNWRSWTFGCSICQQTRNDSDCIHYKHWKNWRPLQIGCISRLSLNEFGESREGVGKISSCYQHPLCRRWERFQSTSKINLGQWTLHSSWHAPKLRQLLAWPFQYGTKPSFYPRINRW